VENSCEFGDEAQSSIEVGKLSIGLTASGLSSGAQLHKFS
jgi:hypothetical protein